MLRCQTTGQTLCHITLSLVLNLLEVERLSVANQCETIPTGCPMVLRTDLGTENSTVAVIQTALRHNGRDNLSGSSSHRYGRSTGNQVRIVYTYMHTN